METAYEHPAARAARLGMVGPFTPAEYALIAPPVIAPPARSKTKDVVDAEKACAAARARFDTAHDAWIEAVAAHRGAELLGRATGDRITYTGTPISTAAPGRLQAIAALAERAGELHDARDRIWDREVIPANERLRIAHARSTARPDDGAHT